MSQTLEEKRIAELTERIEDFLCEGEEYLIRREEGQTEVLPGAQINPVRRHHEELYGFLLSLNQRLAEAAAIPRWIVRFVFLSLILGLHLDWFSDLALPINFEKLQNWWVYGLIFLFGFAINSLIKELAQHRIYANSRSELLRLLGESGMPKYRLLTQIEGDAALSDAAHILKKDHAQEARF